MLKRLEDRTFILIVAAPTLDEAQKIVREAGIPLPNAHIRHVKNAAGFRGWSRGTPVLTGARRAHWPKDFEDFLTVELARGRFRIAQDADIQRAKGE